MKAKLNGYVNKVRSVGSTLLSTMSEHSGTPGDGMAQIPDIKHSWVWLIMLSAAILTGDFFSGRSIHFSMFYVLPVALSGWTGHGSIAYLFALFLPAFRLAFFIPWGEDHALSLGIVNAVLQITTLIIMAFLARRARGVTELQKRLKILQGILPICMSCKRIKNENGEYEQLEGFIHNHSEADFSHGYCPDCMKKIYPQYSHISHPGQE